MKLEELVAVSAAVAATGGRLEKISRLADLLKRLPPEEVPIAIGFQTGWPRQGRLGVGWATIASNNASEPAAEATLEIRDVDGVFDRLVGLSGRNSGNERARLVAELFARATVEERRFLAALIIGEVRQGALEGVVLEAVARAAGAPSERVRRAVMLAGDLGAVAGALLAGPPDEVLASYDIQLFRPVQPMLADSAGSVVDALDPGTARAIEWKLDGARIQVHRRGDEVAMYTRNLNDVTDRLPEVVKAVRELPARELILDGEVIALAPDGRPYPFQVTMSRFGSRKKAAEREHELPLTAFFFDLLLRDGESVLDHPLSARWERLAEVVPATLRVPRIVTSDAEEARRFEADALARGHEGVVVKSLDASYEAGRRGSAWCKVKPARSLDLVVLGAEWGSGRRRGWLSNLHLGARDPATGGFVMLGKTFKGMTDEMLAWQTQELLARETHREGHAVFVRPELVVEIAFNEVQRSSQYPGGLTLRFARVKGHRPDKRPDEADTIDAVRAFAP